MKRIQKYQTNEKPYDGGTLPEIEVNAKLPTIGAYRQYVKSRNPDFQVSDDGQVIPTSGAVWRDFLNPSYTPDNFGIEEYSDYKTNYEAADDGNPNTRYMPTNLQYAGAGFPGISTLMKIPRLIKMRKRLGLLKKIQQNSKNSMTFSQHVNSTTKTKDVVKTTSKTTSKILDKYNSIPTESKVATGAVVGGKIIYDALKDQTGGFEENYQVDGMQDTYSAPESITGIQQHMQTQQQQMPYPQQQEPQMYQMKGSDQGTSLLDRIESTTRVKGGRLVPIGNGVAIEGNQHDVSKNDAIDGFTEGVEFAPGKAAEGGEVMANAQVNGNSGEYMFSEAMKLNGKFGYKKGLGPSIADGAKNVLASDLPKQIEQEKLNRLALMQETNKPDTNEDGMAKNYEYSKYGGFPNKKYQSGDYEKYQSLGDLFSWNQGTITPYVPPVDPEADNPPNQVNLHSRKSLIGSQDLPVYTDDLGFPSVKIPSLNNVEPGQFKTLSEDEQIQIALNTTIPAKTEDTEENVKEKKKLPNLNVASTDNWDYGTIPGRQGKATTKGGLKFYNADKDLEAFVNSEGFEEEWLGGIDQEIRESVGISSINDMNDKSKVRAYQKAWNAKNPNNKIKVDGDFGEQTIRTARLKSAEEVVEEEGDKECGPGGCGDTEENLNNTLSTLDKIENKKRSRWGEGVNKMGKYLSKNGLDLIAGGIQLAGPIAAYKKPIRMATAVTAPGYRGSRVNFDSLIKQATDQGNARKQTARNNITGPGLEQVLAKIDAETQASIMKIKDGESNQNLSLQDSEAKINTQINQGNATAMNRIEELNTKNLIQHDVDKVEAIDRATNRIANVIGNYQDRKTREFSAEIISGETGVYTRMDFQKQTGMTAASNPEAYIQWLELNNPAMLKRLKADKLTDTKTEETEENN
jgi:hypothetical protein